MTFDDANDGASCDSRLCATANPVRPEPMIAKSVVLGRVGDRTSERCDGGSCQNEEVGLDLGNPGSFRAWSSRIFLISSIETLAILNVVVVCRV